jgi:flagellar assembly protein FliH
MTWSPDWAGPAQPAAPTSSAPQQWVPVELDLLPASVADGRSAEHIREDAEAAAWQQRQAELDEAFDRGFEEGRQHALNAERKRVDVAVASLMEAAEEVRTAQGMWVQDARENICALAVGVARHIIGRELRGDAHAIVDLARQALLKFPVDEPVSVFFNPEDLSLISAASAADGTRIAPGREVEWTADATLSPGGCIVEGRLRLVDGRIDHALERIYQKLIDD